MTIFDDINTSTDLPVVSTVSPSLHPAMLIEPGKILAADDSPATAAAYKAARAAQGLLYNGLSLIEDAHRTTQEQHSEKLVVDGKSIRGEINDQQKQILANAMGDAFNAVATKFDSHLGTVTTTQENLEATIAKQLLPPKQDATTAVAASDLRKIVASQADPMGYLASCIRDQDVEVIHSVLCTSPRASGLSKEQFATLKEMAAEAFTPKETAQLKAIKQVREALLRSATVFTSRYGKLLPVVKPTPANVARENLKTKAGA